jgi:hypothetical protein
VASPADELTAVLGPRAELDELLAAEAVDPDRQREAG